jgi:hypothetical protein
MFAHIRILAGGLGVLGFSALITLPAYAQNYPFNRDNTRDNTILNRTLSNEPIIRINPGVQNRTGSTSSYPYSSRISGSGAITTPRGQVIYPNVGVTNGDGSTTYYYPNGTSITVDKTRLPATGGFLR